MNFKQFSKVYYIDYHSRYIFTIIKNNIELDKKGKYKYGRSHLLSREGKAEEQSFATGQDWTSQEVNHYGVF